MKNLSEYNLSTSGTSPIYERVKQILLDYIAHLPLDEHYLPFEYILEEELHVSRRSIRRALEELRRDGMIQTARNRGSKILRRTTKPMEQRSEIPLTGLNLGAVIVSNEDFPGPTPYLPWNVITHFEQLIGGLGANLSFFNMRDQLLKGKENEVIERLVERQISWVFLYPHPDIKPQFWLETFQRLRIKTVMLFKDFYEFKKGQELLRPGSDFIVLNHEYVLLEKLNLSFRKMDKIFYFSFQLDSFWNAARIAIISKFAQENNIQFECLSDSSSPRVDYLSEEWYDGRVKLGYLETMKIRDVLTSGKKILLLPENDNLAIGVMKALKELSIDPGGNVQVAGYDNSPECRGYNMSTFDFNVPGIADALLALLKQYLTAPEESLNETNGKVVLPRYVKRSTAD